MRLLSPRGLVASVIVGLVIVFGESILNGVILSHEWTQANERLGLGPPSIGLTLLALAKLFLLGFVIIWLYEAIRPKFGASRWTAVIAGGFISFIIWVWVLVGLLMAGYVNSTMAWVTVVWGAFEVPLASVLGVTYLERGFGSR